MVATDRPFVEGDSAKVSMLKIETPEETVEMTKQGDKWMLTKPLTWPVAEKTAENAVAKLREMKKLSLITQKADRFADFQVDDSAATKVTFGQGGKTVTFYLGKAGPTMQTSYARLAGSSEVWEITGNHSGMFKRKTRDWRDKTITNVTMEDMRKLTLRYPDQAISASLQDTIWKVDAGREVFDGDKSSVEKVTRLLSRISAVDFADTLAPEFFDNPDFQITAELNDGETIDLKLKPVDETASKYFVRKAGAMADFVIYKATATNLMKKTADFKGSSEETSIAKKVASS